MSNVAEWFYARGDQQQGPVTLDGLRALAAAGQLVGTDLVWQNGTPDWRPAAEVPEIFQAPTAAAAPAAMPMSPGYPGAYPTAAPGAPGGTVYAGPRLDPGWGGDKSDASEREIPIPSYLVQSILCTLFCCMPFGVIAIVHAAMVGSKMAVGDFGSARDMSDKARMWCRLSFWCGFGIGVLYLIAALSGALSGSGGGRGMRRY